MSSVAVMWFGGDRIQSGQACRSAAMTAFPLRYLMRSGCRVMMATFMFMMVPRRGGVAERIQRCGRPRQRVGGAGTRLRSTAGPVPEMSDVEFRYPGPRTRCSRASTCSQGPARPLAVNLAGQRAATDTAAVQPIHGGGGLLMDSRERPGIVKSGRPRCARPGRPAVRGGSDPVPQKLICSAGTVAFLELRYGKEGRKRRGAVARARGRGPRLRRGDAQRPVRDRSRRRVHQSIRRQRQRMATRPALCVVGNLMFETLIGAPARHAEPDTTRYAER